MLLRDFTESCIKLAMTDWKALIAELRGPKEKPLMTLADIARECEVRSTSTISEIAQGRTKQPRGNIALKLANLQQRKRRRASQQ